MAYSSDQKLEKLRRKLPVQVSKIEVQKKRKQRYSLFDESGFLIGVSEEALIQFNLRKGVEITPSLFDALLVYEDRQKIKDYLIGLISRRDHASKELLDKGAKKGYSREILNEIIEELEHKGFINNQSFAFKYASDKSRLSKWGEMKIRNELIKKGISNKIINQVLEEVATDDDQYEIIKELIIKRKSRYQGQEKRKQKEKIYRYLLGKGFPSGLILKHIDDLLSLID